MKITTLSVIFVSALSAQTIAPSWELADPKARVLIGIDVRGLRESPVGKSISSQMGADMPAMPALPFKLPGLELLNDIDHVFVATTGEVPAPKPAVQKPGAPRVAPTAAAASQNPPFLVVLTGTFPEEHLRPLLQGKHSIYKAFNIYGDSGTNGANFAVLDDHRVILGDEKSIRAAIDREGLKPAGVSSVFARAQELAASNDFWMVGQDTASSLQKAAGANPFASEIDGLEIGLQLHEGLGLDVSLLTKTEAAAGVFAHLLSAQLANAVSTKLDDARAVELARKLQIGSQGNRMTVHIALSKEEVEQSIQLAEAARANAGAARASAGGARSNGTPAVATAPRPAAPAPSAPRTIKIYGLEGGVREIPMDPKK